MNMEHYFPMLFLMSGVGILGILTFFVYAAYLAHKWLPSVEMTMLGRNVHTANILFSIHAIIMFGSVFAWDWYARRQKSIFDDRDWFLTRESVPRSARTKFIFAFTLLMISCCVFLLPLGVLKLLGA